MSEQDIQQLIQDIIDSAQDSPGFPAFAGGQLDAFDAIVSQLGSDPRTPYPPLDPTELQPPTVTRPSSVAQADWDAVVSQLSQQLGFQDDAHTFFQQFSSFFDDVYISNLSYLDSAMQLVAGSDDDSASFALGAILAVGGTAVSEALPTGGWTAVALVNVFINYLENSTDVSTGTLSADFDDLSSTMSSTFQDALTAIETMEQSVLGSWVALQKFNKGRTDGTLEWPDPDDAIRTAAITAYKVSMWQTLLPEVWHIVAADDNPHHEQNVDWIDGYLRVNPNYYIDAQAAGSGYTVNEYWLGRGDMVLNAKQPSNAMCNEIFTTLGVPRSDVFNEVNGWTGFTRETWMQNGGCATAMMARAAGRRTGRNHLRASEQVDFLRQVRADLSQSAMGRWYDAVYDEISDPIVALYHDLSSNVQTAINQYDGYALYDAMVDMVQTKQSQFSNQQLANGLAIVAAVVQASVTKNGEGNPIETDLNLIMPLLPGYTGKTYEEVLATIAGQTPPSAVPAPAPKRSRAK